MSRRDRDPGAEMLLDPDGQLFVVDTKGGYWVRYLVARAEALWIISIGWKLSDLIGSKMRLVEDFWAEVDTLLREKGVIE